MEDRNRASCWTEHQKLPKVGLYAELSDIEPAQECDGCAQENHVVVVPIPPPRSDRITSADDLTRSPTDFVRGMLADEAADVAARLDSYFEAFWEDASNSVRRERPLLATPDPGWEVARTTDFLTESETTSASKLFSSETSTIAVRLSCDTYTKQLYFSAWDATDEVEDLRIPPAAKHNHDLRYKFFPPPPLISSDRIYSRIVQSTGRQIDLIGFNANNYGTSLCESSGIYPFNSPSCIELRSDLPSDLKHAVETSDVNVTTFKERDFAPVYWTNFDEVRFSITSRWGNPALGQVVGVQYSFAIRPNQPPLAGIFAACDRREDRCLSIADKQQSTQCHSELRREVSRHD